MDTQINPAIDDFVVATQAEAPRTKPRSAPRPRYTLERAMQSIKDFATVSEILRILGAIVMLASMSVFLLQGWSVGNDISRYLLLLSQTGLLAAGGFALSYGLKENKGARVFFGLALISIPANFTILGALLYSVTQWDGGLISYPDFATWQIASAGSTALTLGGAMLALIPLTLLCLSIMARRSARPLTLHFLLLNALLLLPVRSSAAVGVLALAGVAYALWHARRLAAGDKTLMTPEGKFALMTLFIPMGIIVFRSMYFYQIDALLLAMISAAIFMGLRHAATSTDRSERVALVLDSLALPIAILTAWSVTVALDPVIAMQFLGPVFASVFAVLGLDVARRTSHNGLSNCAGALVSLIAGASFIFNVLEFNGPLTALICLLAGAAMVLAGRGLANGFAVFMGYVTALAGLVFGVGEFVELISDSGWVELAIFGASAIAIGSLLDRHGAALKLRISKWGAGSSKAA